MGLCTNLESVRDPYNMLDQFVSRGMKPLGCSHAAGNIDLFQMQIESKCVLALFKILDEKELEDHINGLILILYFKIPIIIMTDFDNVILVDRFKEIQTMAEFGDRLYLFEYTGFMNLIIKMNDLEKYLGLKHFINELESIEVYICSSNKKDRDEYRGDINNILKDLLHKYEVNKNARRSI